MGKKEKIHLIFSLWFARKDIAFESSSKRRFSTSYNQKKEGKLPWKRPFKIPSTGKIKSGEVCLSSAFARPQTNKKTKRWKFNILGLKIDPYNEQLPTGMITHLVEHCTGIAEVWVRIPLRPSSLLHKLRKKTARSHASKIRFDPQFKCTRLPCTNMIYI